MPSTKIGIVTGEIVALAIGALSPFTNQRRNGRAFSSLTARGGGLPIGVIDLKKKIF
jgi:hypothetical protein